MASRFACRFLTWEHLCLADYLSLLLIGCSCEIYVVIDTSYVILFLILPICCSSCYYYKSSRGSYYHSWKLVPLVGPTGELRHSYLQYLRYLF